MAPRRKATINTKCVDWLSGKSGWIHSRSPGSRLGTWPIGSVTSSPFYVHIYLGTQQVKCLGDWL